MVAAAGSVVLQNHGSYIPLSLIAKNLEPCSSNELEFFLYNLRSNNYITQDITINDYTVFINKIIKMLNSQSVFDSWKALQVINVLFAYNPIVLCSFSKTIIKELGDKLEFIFKKNRLNSSSTSKEYFKALIFTISHLIKLLRNKPVLKREVLTPNLPVIIKMLINKLPEVEDLGLIEIFIKFLKDLLVNNTSVFKPYVNKYHDFIKSRLSSETYLQDEIIENYAFCHLINLNYQSSIEKNNGNNADNKHLKVNVSQAQWNSVINAIFVETKKILALYEDILDIDEYTKSLIKKLPTGNDEAESIFSFLPVLKLDLNEANTLFQINSRMKLFAKILNKFITLPTPFQIRFNTEFILNLGNILISLQNFKLLKGLRKDTNVISCLSLNLISLSYDVGLPLLQTLLSLNNGFSILPFSNQLLSVCQNFLIPLYNAESKTKSFNLNKVMSQKLNLVKLFTFLTNILSSNNGIIFSNLKNEDLETWNELLVLSIVLLKEDQSLYYKLQHYTNTVNQNKNGAGGKKKSNLQKKTDTISDIYTVPGVFCSTAVLDSLSEVIFKFLIEVIKTTRITTNVRTLIEKQAIVDSNQELMKWLVINPSLESSNQSILPIVSTLSDSDIKAWLKSTIIPKLPQNFIQQHFDSVVSNKAEEMNLVDDDMWIEKEDEVKEEMNDLKESEEEPPLKKQKLAEISVEESEQDPVVVEKQTTGSNIEPLVLETSVEAVVEEVAKVESEAEENESDLEIPELDLS